MEDTVRERTERESSQRELYRLIRWAKNNTEDWERICNSESYSLDIACIFDLIERLYEEKLYTAIYFVIYSNHFVLGIDWVISKTTNECFLDTPIEVLLERFRKNLEIHTRESIQKEHSEG